MRCPHPRVSNTSVTGRRSWGTGASPRQAVSPRKEGGPSPSNCARTTERNPSAPTNQGQAAFGPTVDERGGDAVAGVVEAAQLGTEVDPFGAEGLGQRICNCARMMPVVGAP